MGKLVLWFLFVGGVVDLGDVNKGWFKVRISKVAEELRLREWVQVKAVLRKFSWVEELHDRPCLALWNETVMMLHSLDVVIADVDQNLSRVADTPHKVSVMDEWIYQFPR